MIKRELPDKFLEFLLQATGEDLFPLVKEAIESSSPVTSIRLNPFKPLPPEIQSFANNAIEMNDRVPWCSDGYYLPERPYFTHDPSLHAGAYYVQEASSMFLETLRPLLNSFTEKPIRILDLCAAPGGKSTHLISMAPPESHIVVNEVVKNRLPALKENIIKWGVHSVNITSREASAFASRSLESQQFDFILVDAPCSGEGMFRKDPVAIKEWSEESVMMCAKRQRSILADIWPALAPGGYLAYSTCTFNIYENDLNLKWLREELGALPADLATILANLATHPGSPVANPGIIAGKEGGFRFFPGLVRGEGFFFALFRKPSGESSGESSGQSSGQSLGQPSGQSSEKLSKKPFSQTSHHSFGQASGKQSYKQSAKQPNSHLQKKSDANPQIVPEDAFSILPDKRFPTVELSKEDALSFLARRTIVIKDAPLGYLLVTYGGLPLGYVKNIGTRANNLYPMNWRILKI